jgi:S-formylglutathione hydrolase FrmB
MRTLLLIVVLAGFASGDDDVRVTPATIDAGGCAVHDVTSPYQPGTTQLRVLAPDNRAPGRRFPVIYLLPVEAAAGHRYGDPLAEIKKHNLHNKHAALFVAPTFAQLPWYADHPTDPAVRQETYFLKVVVPTIEKTHPAIAEPRGRLLLGFSKSGWGAWTLLLRHPDVFARAVAWDAPLAMHRPGSYGSGPIFGTPENFAHYQVARLLRDNAAALQGDPRLILLGYDNFRRDHQQLHALLDELKVPHVYRDGPQRTHDWHGGWVAEAVELLLPLPPP